MLVGSTEHYGSVLNLDFDYVRYLDVLKSDGLNLTRTFSGYYREVPGSFGIRGNTLAPAEGRYSAPWAVVGGKYDLTKWNDEHFKRMRDFVAKAGERGVVVEMSIFCPFYEDVLWNIDPLNAEEQRQRRRQGREGPQGGQHAEAQGRGAGPGGAGPEGGNGAAATSTTSTSRSATSRTSAA